MSPTRAERLLFTLNSRPVLLIKAAASAVVIIAFAALVAMGRARPAEVAGWGLLAALCAWDLVMLPRQWRKTARRATSDKGRSP